MIKILFLAANPRETPWVKLDAQSRAIDEALRDSEYRDKFQLEKHFAVRVRDLTPLLLRHKPTIVHFTGHGSTESKIALEDDAGGIHPVSPQALSRLFSVLKDDIQCVVLMACYSEGQAQAIAEHIDYVVGMSDAITDSAAISFASTFYLGLGHGRDVKTAFDLGCVQLELLNIPEEHIPKLIAKKVDPSEVVLVSPKEKEKEDTVQESAAPPASSLPSRINFDWVKIPAGEFLYGETKENIYLDEFYISRTLVTNAQYKVFVDATGHELPEHWKKGRIPRDKENHPVVFVNWHDAQAFCNWAGVHLLSEHQWEKAARGTDGRIYPWGNEDPNEHLCNFRNLKNFNRNVNDTTPVGRYSPQGDSPYRVADVAGNVWEWCEDWYDGKRKHRVLRGGSFKYILTSVRCTHRHGYPPDFWLSDFGIRVASPGL